MSSRYREWEEVIGRIKKDMRDALPGIESRERNYVRQAMESLGGACLQMEMAGLVSGEDEGSALSVGEDGIGSKKVEEAS